ncbi:MAG: ABC-type Fe3+-siderophore transport system permease subunit, partial [Moritella dasanensis]
MLVNVDNKTQDNTVRSRLLAKASLNVFSKLLLMGLFMLALLSVGTFALVPNMDLFDSYQQTYVFQLLLPTLLIAVLSGALLAQSGTVVQVTLGNDFASPSTIGISSGALLGAMLVNLFVTDPSIWMVWIAAFVAAVMIAGLILTLSQVIGGGKLQLILIGMA